MGPSATGGGQFAVIARKKALDATYKEIEGAVRDLVKRMNP